MQDFELELLKRLKKFSDSADEGALRQAHQKIVEESAQWTTDQK
ncbi:MAG: hypothetical protein PVJ57_20710 [Phycisphaerae bacterium]|jgi:hypothetical protein